MLGIGFSRIAVDHHHLVGLTHRNIIRRLTLQLPQEDKYEKMAVTKSNRVNKRFIHLTRVVAIKHKDEYYAKLALKEKQSTDLVSQEFFEDSSEKNRQTFKNAIELFNNRDIRKRGSVEFIYAALKHMKQFDCHR